MGGLLVSGSALTNGSAELARFSGEHQQLGQCSPEGPEKWAFYLLMLREEITQ